MNIKVIITSVSWIKRVKPKRGKKEKKSMGNYKSREQINEEQRRFIMSNLLGSLLDELLDEHILSNCDPKRSNTNRPCFEKSPQRNCGGARMRQLITVFLILVDGRQIDKIRGFFLPNL